MSPCIVDLNGSWQLRRVGTDEVLAAEVPGVVHLDLMRAGGIPDPFYRENEGQLHWIGASAWEYTRTFGVDQAVLARARILLQCDGLDTLATIVVNGQEIGRAANMFRRWEWDLQGVLHEGENTITMVFDSVQPELARWQAERHYAAGGGGVLKKSGTSQVRKEQCNFGWDWGPCCVTCGIWRSLRLVAFDAVRLTDVAVRQVHRAGLVHLTVAVETERIDQSTALTAEIALRREAQEVGRAVAPLAGAAAAAELTVPGPELWWPNGLGAQPLYDLEVTIRDAAGRARDRLSRRIGLRTLELVEADDAWGRSFYFRVNGQRFFAKGANWIPADVFQPRVSAARTRDLLQSGVAAHMNMVRVWGGGLYEEDGFYDLCDELGLVVWQDFMFACAAYPAARPAFLENVRVEADQNVRRLRHHACIGLYCGNNEIEQCPQYIGDGRAGAMSWAEYKLLFEETLPEVVRRLHPGAAYIPSSPYTPQGDRVNTRDEQSGDCHFWDVWHRQQPIESYRAAQPRFCSEFGFQSFPAPRTCQTFTVAEDRHANSPVMIQHQRYPDGNARIMAYLLERFQEPAGFDELLWMSQILQGLALQCAVEHWRRCMPRCMGALYWQLNDCWPGPSWATVDYDGRWKAAHYMARRFFAPLLLSCLENPAAGTLDLHVTSDWPSRQRARIRWTVTDAQGRALRRGWRSVTTPQNGSDLAATLEVGDLLAQKTAHDLMVWPELVVAGEVVSRAVALFCHPKELRLSDPGLTLGRVRSRPDGSFVVRLAAARSALWVGLHLAEADARFSDNFFCLRPGAPRAIVVTPAEPISAAALQQALRVQSLYSLSKPPSGART